MKERDLYHPIISTEGVLIKPGQKAHFVTTGYADSMEAPSPLSLGLVFEVNGQFVFSRKEGKRGNRLIPSEEVLQLGSSRSRDDVVVRNPPRTHHITGTHLRFQASQEGVRAWVPWHVSDMGGLTYVSIKDREAGFGSTELVLPDEYYALSGKHVITPGNSARILCPGEDGWVDFLDQLSGMKWNINGTDRTHKAPWHAGDVIWKEASGWSYVNPRGQTEAEKEIPLKRGDIVCIGREFEEGWQEYKSFELILSDLNDPSVESTSHTVGVPFYGSKIDSRMVSASRRHAVIEIGPEGAIISDFSSHGTRLCVKPSNEAFSAVRRSIYDAKNHWELCSIGDNTKLRSEHHPLITRTGAEVNGFIRAIRGAIPE